jgi:hypothetical protein
MSSGNHCRPLTCTTLTRPPTKPGLRNDAAERKSTVEFSHIRVNLVEELGRANDVAANPAL